MNSVIDLPAPPVLPVAESNKVFPVGRVYCVGDPTITYYANPPTKYLSRR